MLAHADPEAKSATMPPPPLPRSVWANSEQNIPRQDESFAATSAASLRSTEIPVQFPPELDARRSEHKLKVATCAQTRLIQDAYSAANELTVLHVGDSVARLVPHRSTARLISAPCTRPDTRPHLPGRPVLRGF